MNLEKFIILCRALKMKQKEKKALEKENKVESTEKETVK